MAYFQLRSSGIYGRGVVLEEVNVKMPCFFRRDFFADYFVKFYRLFCKFVTIEMAPKSENYEKRGEWSYF